MLAVGCSNKKGAFKKGVEYKTCTYDYIIKPAFNLCLQA